jgi:hypothetical protein
MTLFQVVQIKKTLDIETVNNRASASERIITLPIEIGDLGQNWNGIRESCLWDVEEEEFSVGLWREEKLFI